MPGQLANGIRRLLSPLVASGDAPPEAGRAVAAALMPLRGALIAVMALIPFVIVSMSARLDVFYFQLMIPFIFWGMMEHLTRKRRLHDFVRCCDAAAHPDHVKELMSSGSRVTPGVDGITALVMLVCAKLMILYLLAAKHLIASDNLSDIQFLLMLVCIPVFAEFGSVLLLCGDRHPDQSHPRLPTRSAVFAALLTLPFAAAMWFLASPNTLIMPMSMVLIMVFYWKKRADSSLREAPADSISGACYESCEVAAAFGMLIVHQDPFDRLWRQSADFILQLF